MAEKMVRVLECDRPDGAHDGDVKRIKIVIDRRTVEVDLCESHLEPIEGVIRYAHRKPRARGIEVVDPADIPRRR